MRLKLCQVMHPKEGSCFSSVGPEGGRGRGDTCKGSEIPIDLAFRRTTEFRHMQRAVIRAVSPIGGRPHFVW